MTKLIISYFFFLVFLTSVFVSGVVDSQDGFQYLAVARNIYYQHEITAPPYEYTGGVWVGKNTHLNVQTGKDGKTYSQTGIGYSIAMLPAVILTDLAYKIYSVSPPIHFPLESDWFILFAASFTNVLYTGLLGVILFLYFLKIKLSLRQALFLSLISIFTTNLFALTKHIYAHIPFTAFLLLSFYLIKKYSEREKKIFLILAALSFGITTTIYNQTFLLAILPLSVYYLILTKPKLNLTYLKLVVKDGLLALLILTPFIILYFWLENLRAEAGSGLANPAYFVGYAKHIARTSQIPLIFEGIYGQLFSPGRSIFIYSPVLLLIPIFWHKIKRKIIPELVVFLLLSASYILLYSKQIMIEPWNDNKFISYWHGELSWGPRYLIPLIPFGMLVVGQIYQQLKITTKVLIVGPLLLIGLFVEILGIIIPYQTKLHGLQTDVDVSGYHYTSFNYINLLPQFTPIYSTTKKFQYLINLFPQTLDHGPYNVKFYDGIDFPFNVGLERWRTIENQGYISFDNNSKDPIKKLSLTLINHPLRESRSSAEVKFFLNQWQINASSNILLAGKRSDIEVTFPQYLLKEKNNQLLIDAKFTDSKVLYVNNRDLNKQLIALLGFYINGQPINLESLDFPYISTLGPKTNNITYQNYGGAFNNPWTSWMIHTQIFERTPDFWWIKFLYYWDVPKNFFLALFLINILGIIFFGRKTFQLLRQLTKKG